MNKLDGEWSGAKSDAIIITVPLATEFLGAASDETKRQAIVDLVVGQAARKAHEAITGRLDG